MTHTMHITQDGPANALALNKECNQVVIAGRNVFKVFHIEENEFVENCNLRVGKNLNLNFSCNHVAWNMVEDNILATAATNGAVVLWNLGRTTRSKQDHVFSDHKRTVNKVCFHVGDPMLLISGSQDGTMKCFDLRTREVVRTFYSNSESVRDVQFSPHQHHTFTAVSENGNVQLWDLRRADKYLQQFTAHSGPIFACDWHPEVQWLATASRDKTIKVWDLKESKHPTLEYTINTIASIGHIKWRPSRKYHIASCALVVDCNVNVWDVRRPYIPFAAFDQHKDVATGIAWRGNPHTFLSTSRDCTLYQHVFKDALRPANSANPQGVSVNHYGDVMYASRVNPPTRILGILKKQPNHSEKFCHASSALHQFTSRNRKDITAFQEAAKRYLLAGYSLSELCDHNAAVAKDLGRHQISLVWSIIKTLYSYPTVSKTVDYGHRIEEVVSVEKNGVKLPPASSDCQSVRGVDLPGGPEEDTEPDEVQEHLAFTSAFKSMSEFQNDFQVQGDFFFGDGESDPLSMDQLVTTLPQELDWSIQSEAFSIRHEIQEGSPQPDGDPHPSHRSLDNELESSTIAIEQAAQCHLTVSILPSVQPIDPSHLVVDTLKHHADHGDVQTSVAVLFVLGEKRRELALDVMIQEHWFLTYLDLLGRCKLWDISTQIIQLSWIPSINQLSQQSTTIYTSCGECSKPLLRTGWLCDRCHSASHAICSLCHEIVRGMYTWCQGCGHGGHLAHFSQWYKTNKHCPTGCGHLCEYT